MEQSVKRRRRDRQAQGVDCEGKVASEAVLRQSAVPGRSCEVADQPIVVRSADQPTPAKLVGQVLALCAEVGPAAGDQCSTYRALRRPPLWPPSHAQPREEKVLIKVPPACRPSAARRRGTPSSHRRAGRRLRGEDAHQDPTGVQAGGGAENELIEVPPACRQDQREGGDVQDPTGVQAGCCAEEALERDEVQSGQASSQVEHCDADALPHGRSPSVAVGGSAEQDAQHCGQ